VLARVRAGDLIALHDCAPPGGGSVEAWLGEVDGILTGLEARGLAVPPLSAVLGRPVMEPAAQAEALAGLGAVRFFYDGLAAHYDAEQRGRGQGGVRAAEHEIVLDGLAALATPGGRVLEVGAGTGRFSLALSRRSGEVVALDLSEAMLAVLREKARAEGLDNIQTLAGDLHRLDLEQTFDLVCAFSVLEYSPDLAGALAILAGRLRPGGRLWLTTAHAGLPRLIGQIGNALRQGVWLHARTLRYVRRSLIRAGLRVERLRSFGPLGLLLEAQAEKPSRTGPAAATGPGP